ncbi:phasin family protein [Sphingomonas sp. ac-8]|uniref:phasin family protein n=1 Tax=Sphingomonas sp. ac-8 TaxID=3242977 RepID=UPI003A7FD6FF
MAEKKPVQVPFAAPAAEPVERLVAPVEAQLETVVDQTADTAEAIVETARATVGETSGAAAPAAPAPEEPTMIHTNDATATVSNDAAATAQNLFGDMNARTKAAVEKSSKTVEELTDLAKGNVEALVEAGRIAAKGFESMGQDAADFGRRNFENATATMKTLAAVKSPTEFFKLQSDFFRNSFDSLVAETSKNTEAFLKLANDAAQPLSNRVAIATDKLKAVAA